MSVPSMGESVTDGTIAAILKGEAFDVLQLGVSIPPPTAVALAASHLVVGSRPCRSHMSPFHCAF